MPKPLETFSVMDLFPDDKKPEKEVEPQVFPGPIIFTTLEEAQNWVRQNMAAGVQCPCCDKFVKQYARPFNATMARSLLWLVKSYEAQGGTGWVHVSNTAPRWLVRSNQLPTLRWWGFVERPEKSDDPSKKHSGRWRPTTAGIEAAYGRARFPKKAITTNGDLDELTGDMVFLSETLGKKFDYQEVMQTILHDDPDEDVDKDGIS